MIVLKELDFAEGKAYDGEKDYLLLTTIRYTLTELGYFLNDGLLVSYKDIIYEINCFGTWAVYMKPI